MNQDMLLAVMTFFVAISGLALLIQACSAVRDLSDNQSDSD